MRELGAPVLRIPDNYYDDLDARLAPPPDLLAALRENSILYDSDGDGEYLHFFTEMLGSRLFFEVVQRVGGYGGYGAAGSAPVRMAAHRHRRLQGLRDGAGRPDGRVHDYSLAHLTALSLSPPELVEAAADAGYRYVGVRLTRVTPQEPHYPLATDPALMRTTKVRLAATGVEVLDIELARIGPHEDPRDFQRFLEAGAELGARHVITQLPDPDRNRKVDRFAQLCEMARPLGLTVDLEFPSWTETPDLGEATRVLRAADQPNAGMLIDLLHFARSGSSVADLRELLDRMVPLRARLRRGRRRAADQRGAHTHRAVRAALSGRGRHRPRRDPGRPAAGPAVRAGDPAGAAGGPDRGQGTRPHGDRRHPPPAGGVPAPA
nr:hypothetical protein GCM10020092_069530 [Actinoplanes digitatis]